jgi:hypothetical protein
MSTLAVEQLETGLSIVQPITVTRPIQLGALKPYLYVHGMPAGTFKVQLKKLTTVIKEWTFTAAQAQAAFGGTLNYFHVYLALTSEPFTIKPGEFTIELSATGYVASSGSFIGWCKDFAGPTGAIIGTPSDFTSYPLSFRIIETREREP